ncbi:MAG: hypothetical protein ABN502_18055 [Gammaproteobacteria bacterium]
MADLTEIGQGTYKHSGVVYRALDKTTNDGLRLFQAVEHVGDVTPIAVTAAAPMPVHSEL